MTAKQFSAALKRIGGGRTAISRRLRVPMSRMSEWSTGARPVPPYIAAHVESLLELRELRARVSSLEQL